MKKTGFVLLISLLLTLFQPCAAATATNVSETAGSGYIVKLREPSENQVRLMENVDMDEIYAEKGLYRVDSIDDVKKLGDMVEYSEPDYTATLFAVPNDTFAKKQWNLEKLHISDAWNKGYEGNGVRVAVIDSGVNSLHEDFEGVSFDKGSNMINGSHDVTDETGHGTGVCGIIAAARNNALGIAGLCSGITLVPIKCFGKSVETNASYIVSAVYEAVDVYDCDVINLSLGTTSDMQSMRDAVNHAEDLGAIVISAVGNDGTTAYNYPAAFDNVIGVGSVDKNGAFPSFSQTNDSVCVVAPGVEIYSISGFNKNKYISGDGTSFSSPHVTVAAAILKQYYPQATYDDFFALLKQSAVDLGAPGYDTKSGYGSLDIAKFINAMEAYDTGDSLAAFKDVHGHWAEKDIRFCVDKMYFQGVSATSFAPEASMNRAMFVTVLSRMSGEDMSSFPNTFSDVPNSEWYAKPCGWGAATGIVTGSAPGKFNPNGNITREQIASMLYRYATTYNLSDGSYNEKSVENYTDYSKVSSWAKQSMAWAVENGLLSGRTSTTLAPMSNAKRCEVASIISRFSATFAA
ncbi:MAG: S8 family serine peptidase [Oscillospiraceae bacterium]